MLIVKSGCFQGCKEAKQGIWVLVYMHSPRMVWCYPECTLGERQVEKRALHWLLARRENSKWNTGNKRYLKRDPCTCLLFSGSFGLLVCHYIVRRHFLLWVSWQSLALLPTQSPPLYFLASATYNAVAELPSTQTLAAQSSGCSLL